MKEDFTTMSTETLENYYNELFDKRNKLVAEYKDKINSSKFMKMLHEQYPDWEIFRLDEEHLTLKRPDNQYHTMEISFIYGRSSIISSEEFNNEYFELSSVSSRGSFSLNEESDSFAYYKSIAIVLSSKKALDELHNILNEVGPKLLEFRNIRYYVDSELRSRKYKAEQEHLAKERQQFLDNIMPELKNPENKTKFVIIKQDPMSLFLYRNKPVRIITDTNGDYLFSESETHNLKVDEYYDTTVQISKLKYCGEWLNH